MSHLVPEPYPKTHVELIREAAVLLENLEALISDPDALPSVLVEALDAWKASVAHSLDDRHGIY